jgi:hypothetical protein
MMASGRPEGPLDAGRLIKPKNEDDVSSSFDAR